MSAAAVPSSSASAARRGNEPAGAILFTAFEPSGDDHASAVIRVLRRRHPDLRMYAWGGPRMEAAGATVIERTGDNAVMGLPGWSKIREHQQINRRIDAWLGEHPEVRLHVPVDSPAANFPICKIAKRHRKRVVHLVAPQVWAWGPWRVNKLRRLTDLVLCLLPFEQTWFEQKRVPARFIGHPLFDETHDERALAARAAELGQGAPRVALLPGSRPAELSKNFPLLLESFRRLRTDFHGAVGVVAATNERVAEGLRADAQRLGGWPAGLEIVAGETDAVIRWCQIALTVSGTVTLQIARVGRPMVIVYKSSRLFYNLLGRWLVSAPFFTLPNLIAGREIVPELVPHFGDAEPIVEQASRLIEDESLAARQVEELRRISAKFDHLRASEAAADAIEPLIGLARTAG
ncbi:MAG: lipid-A-disaccharide synthase [Phycisphaerales bacterium]